MLTFGDEQRGWASITSWRSTGDGWQTQRLVSTGGPVASCAVLPAGRAVRIADGVDRLQNWFRPTNRFAAAAFGGMMHALPPDVAAVCPGEYLAVPRSIVTDVATGTRIDWISSANDELIHLANRVRGNVYVAAEELAGDDRELGAVEWPYRTVGLRRFRRVWVCYDAAGHALGAALAYRGPLGFNFSFLENRCDLLIDPDVPDMGVAQIATWLLGAAAMAYMDSEPDFIPVVATRVPLKRCVQRARH